jgi:hypothetical protein
LITNKDPCSEIPASVTQASRLCFGGAWAMLALNFFVELDNSCYFFNKYNLIKNRDHRVAAVIIRRSQAFISREKL